jgi:hypothetical protein
LAIKFEKRKTKEEKIAWRGEGKRRANPETHPNRPRAGHPTKSDKQVPRAKDGLRVTRDFEATFSRARL